MRPGFRTLACALAALSLFVFLGMVARAQQPHAPQITQTVWGEPITWPGVTTTYTVYKQNYVYGASPFLITDTRTEPQYSDKESYETRSLTVYRAHDGRALRENQSVVFFVHGGAWTDGYENWYSFVAQSFTGEKGWVTVVIDYRLTSEQVFLADAYCPNRAICAEPANASLRTKAAWYPDNIQDVAAAFQWTVQHIGANGGNAQQIIVFGHSAGGHLATLLATHPSYAALRPAIKGLVSMSGAYLLKSLSMATFGAALDQTFHGGHVNNDAALDEASPSTYVVPGITLPPIYLLRADPSPGYELPSLTEQTLAFASKLQALGLPMSSSILFTYTHTSEMEAIGNVHASPTALIVRWIEETLRLDEHRLYLPCVR